MPCLSFFTPFFNKRIRKRPDGRPNNKLGGLTTPGPPQLNTSVFDNEHELVTTPSWPSQRPGILYRAQNTTLHNVLFFENNEYRTGEADELAAMKILRAHADPNAAVDSSAREPLPTCHPKTRREIRNKLTNLFDDTNREYLIAWLSGPAGSGKTAVGQTFSMKCHEKHRLGGAFFFSRPNGRNRYETVVPTLVYQLTVHCPSYRIAVLARIERDHQIFDKAPSIQFKRLLVEPLLQVRSQIRTTFLMLLDGFDECGAHPTDAYEREREQQELIEMIADSVRNHPDLPLFWLFCSRPEHHLQKAFADVGVICRHEALAIDAKCREEVEMVLRDGFAKIAKNRDVIAPGPDGWPSKEEFDKVERAVAGLHVFGAAILKDIECSDSPVRQLKSLTPFLERIANAGSSRSIAVMDLFYIHILEDVPKIDLPTTLKILGTLITMPRPDKLSVQALCNFLRLDPNDFSSALRKVHSIVSIPPTESVHDKALHYYHASLSDFLTNGSRSGEFFINIQTVRVDLIKLFFFWQGLHFNLFHSSNRPFVHLNNLKHDHDPLPLTDLTWIMPASTHQTISDQICRYTEKYCFSLFGKLSNEYDEDLLPFVHDLNLRHIPDPGSWSAIAFLKWVSEQDPSSGFIRTEPVNDEDRKLLTYLEAVTKKPISPTSFPVDWTTRRATYQEYLFIGRGERAIIVWITRVYSGGNLMALNLDWANDERIIQEYENSNSVQQWLKATQRLED